LLATVLLVALAIGVAGYKASYDADQTRVGSESAQALEDMETGFPAGTLHRRRCSLRATVGRSSTPRR
jgi:RND superfamily putative drug exporter